MNNSMIGRAAFYRALREKDQESIDYLTELLSLKKSLALPDVATRGNITNSLPAITSEIPKKQYDAQLSYWLATKFRTLRDFDAARAQQESVPRGKYDEHFFDRKWKETPDRDPEFMPISDWRTISPRLRRSLVDSTHSRELDVRRVVSDISAGKLIRRFPLKKVRRWGSRLILVIDRSDHLRPYSQDQSFVQDHLADILPPGSLETVYGTDPLRNLKRHDREHGTQDFSIPAIESHVLVLGDLGVLKQDDGKSTENWLRWGARLKRYGFNLIALVPAPQGQVPDKLFNSFSVFSWLPNPNAKSDIDQQVHRILLACAPTFQAELPLIRRLRQVFPGIHAGIESHFYQSPKLSYRTSTKTHLDRSFVDGVMVASGKSRSEFESLPQEQRIAILRTIREHHYECSATKEIWMMELLAMPESCQQLVARFAPEDLDYAVAYARMMLDEVDSNEAAWFFSRQITGRIRERIAQMSNEQAREIFNEMFDATHPPEADLEIENADAGQFPPGQQIQTFAIDARNFDFTIENREQQRAAGAALTIRGSNEWFTVSNAAFDVPEAHLSEDAEFFAGPDDTPSQEAVAESESAISRVAQPLAVHSIDSYMHAISKNTPISGDLIRFNPEAFDERGFSWQIALNLAMVNHAMGMTSPREALNKLFGSEYVLTENRLFDTRLLGHEWCGVMAIGNDVAIFATHCLNHDTVLRRQKHDTKLAGFGSVQSGLFDVYESLGVASLIAQEKSLPEKKLYITGHGLGAATAAIFAADYAGSHLDIAGIYTFGQPRIGKSDLQQHFDRHGLTERFFRFVNQGDPVVNFPAQLVNVGTEILFDDNGTTEFGVTDFAATDFAATDFAVTDLAAIEKNETLAHARKTSYSRTFGVDRSHTIEIPDLKRIVIKTDLQQVQLEKIHKPTWASAWGRDRYGMWADLKIDPLNFVARGKNKKKRSRKKGKLTAEPLNQRMRWIPPGQFLMGSPESEEGRWRDEGPQHLVTISDGFWMFDAPCTQGLWLHVMHENPSHFQDEENPKLDHPVEQVTWQQCMEFCEKLSNAIPDLPFNLPTEAQWEFACRAGTNSAIYSGNQAESGDVDRIAWYSENSDETKTVRQKHPNQFGLYDMLGNVWEWCRDDQRQYNEASAVDPIGDVELGASSRVLRGGSWDYYARYVRSACRYAYEPGYRNSNLGFRCISSPSKRVAGDVD